MQTKAVSILALALVAAAAGLLISGNARVHAPIELLNVSYDPTREVYGEVDSKFASRSRLETGAVIGIRQSHGGSSRQARAVEDGLAADVVTLGLPSDVELLHKFGLVAGDWRHRFPYNAQPYFSTIVFVVRKGNPHNIQDWSDLATPGVEVVTPNPRTSANGSLSFLAAWGSVIYRGGTEAEARDLVARIFRNVGTLGSGARDSSNTFELAGVGDVQATWENEAIRETRASRGELEIVYPPVSIRAEPSVAIIDKNVAKHNVGPVAQAYLGYLFDDEAQEIFAKYGYRPSHLEILAKHRDVLPDITLFPITVVARDWDDARVKFFGEGGIFDEVRSHLATHD
jgi:sulfate/thiosulfate transport system substrate-binding protein